MKKHFKMAIALSFLFILTLSAILLPKISAYSQEEHIKSMFQSGKITINTDKEVTEETFPEIIYYDFLDRYRIYTRLDNTYSNYSFVEPRMNNCDYEKKTCNFSVAVGTDKNGTRTEKVEEYNDVKVSINKDIDNLFTGIVRDNKLIINGNESMFTDYEEKQQFIYSYISALGETNGNNEIRYSFEGYNRGLVRSEYTSGVLMDVAVKKIDEIVFEYKETHYSNEFKQLTSGTITIKINGTITDEILDDYISAQQYPNIRFTNEGSIVNNKATISMCKYENNACVPKERHIVNIKADPNIDTSVYKIFNFTDKLKIPAAAPSENDKMAYASQVFYLLDYSKKNADGSYIMFNFNYNWQTQDEFYNVYTKRDKNNKLLDIQYRKINVEFTGYSNTYSAEYKNRIGTEIVVNSDIKDEVYVSNALGNNGVVLSCNSDYSQCDVALINENTKTVEIHRVNIRYNTTISPEFKNILKLKSDSSIDIIADADIDKIYGYYDFNNIGGNNSVDLSCYNDSTCIVRLSNLAKGISETHTLKVNYIASKATADYLARVEMNKEIYAGENTNFWNNIYYIKPFNKKQNDSVLMTSCSSMTKTCTVGIFNSNNQIELHKVKANFKEGTSKAFQAAFPNNTMKLNAVYKDDEDYILKASMAHLMSKTKNSSYISNYNNRTGLIIFNRGESHTVNIEFEKGNAAHQNAVNQIINKLDSNSFSFISEDLEFIKEFADAHYDPSTSGELISINSTNINGTNSKNINDTLNKAIGNKHISFYYAPEYTDGSFYTSKLEGKLLLLYDGIAYGTTNKPITLTKRSIIYIPDDTKDDIDSYIAAAQKRIDDYLGKSSGVVVQYAGKAREDEIKYLGIDQNKFDGNNYIIIRGNHMIDLLIVKDSSKITKTTPFIATDVTSNIKISSDKANYPTDTVLSTEVLAKDDQESIDLLKKLKLSAGKVVDISLYSPTLGDIKDFQGAKFKVSIPLHDFDYQGKILAAYYVREDGTVETYPVVMDGFIATFETTHFSKYTIGVKEGAPLKGDLNGDGKLNLTDILIELKIFFGNIKPTEGQLAIGDMNASGEINLTDVLLLLKEFFKA